MDSEEVPSVEWEIQEIPSKCSSSKVSLILNKGWRLGKKIIVTSVVISSAPFVVPPLLVFSTLGFAFSVPFGFVFASYACTEKIMSKLLARPIPRSVLEDHSEVDGEDAALEDEEEELIELFEDGNEGREVEEESGKEQGGVELVEKEVSKQATDETGIVEKGDYGDVDIIIEDEEKSVEDVEGMIEEEGKDEERVHGFVEGEEKPLGEISEGRIEENVGDIEEENKLMRKRKGLREEEGEPVGNVQVVVGRRDGEDVDAEQVQKPIDVVSRPIVEGRRGMDSFGDEIMGTVEEKRNMDDVAVGVELEKPIEETREMVKERGNGESIEVQVEGRRGLDSDGDEIMGTVEERRNMDDVDVGVEEEENLIEETREMVKERGNGVSIEEVAELGEQVGGKERVIEERRDGGRLEETGERTGGKTSEVTAERKYDKNADTLEMNPVQDLGHIFEGRRGDKNVNGIVEVEKPIKIVEKMRNVDVDDAFVEVVKSIEEIREVVEERGNGVSIKELAELGEPIGWKERLIEERRDGGNLEEDGEITVRKTSEVIAERGDDKNADTSELKPEQDLQHIFVSKRGNKNVNDIMEVEKSIEEMKKMMNEPRDKEIVDSMLKDKKKPTVETQEMVQEGKPKNNVEEDSCFEREMVMEEMISSNADNVREIAHQSWLDLFHEDNAAIEQYPLPVFEMPEGKETVAVVSGYYSTDHTFNYESPAISSRQASAVEECSSDKVYNERADSVGYPVLSAILAGVAAQKEITAPSNEVLYSEEKIWEQIDALRTIVGYKATLQVTCIEELKALYIFAGVEPPASFKDSSDLVEVNDKLRFLMSIVGVK